MKKRTLNLITIILIIGFTGCQASLPRQTVPREIFRTAEMPLVVAIPGLNLPPVADSKIHFGDLTQMLDAEGIPSITLAYDSTMDPVTNVADLSSSTHSLAVMRVLPRLATAISQENQIRKAQNVPPLKNLDLVVYSQGSVVAWDLLKRLSVFEDQLDHFRKEAGNEWKGFESEPKFEGLNDAIMNFFLIYNIKIQDPEAFRKHIDLQNIYYRAGRNLDKAIERLTKFLWPKDKSQPYPKIAQWIEKHYGKPAGEASSKDVADLMMHNFFMKYAAFRNMVPLQVRIFSIAGSFLGSPQAFAGYFYSQYFPWLAHFFVKNRENQIKDTRLGSRHHLDWTKSIIERMEQERKDEELKEVYYVVGVNGIFHNKGDGLVEQPSAHLSKVSFAEIPVSTVLADLNLKQKDKSPLTLEWERTPESLILGLPVKHLPERFLWRQVPGAAQMTKNSKTYPFFISFIKKDYETFDALYEEEHVPLRQFMVSVYLTDIKEIKRKDLKLKAISKDIKIGKKRYGNTTSNSMTWLGHFKSDDQDTAEVSLEISKGRNQKAKIDFPVHRGKSHFIEILPKTGSELKKAA